ncbi:tRNA pseudouridine(55) synthase TruB [Oceanirhabdus sp. W0125-5]|uniref:tRNA pseudouridine(55) synthase TruB n=1 Tax=Oceanirhabdus sp. W0125-5 TaxID=2999116 RepID=UPI0022F300E1|nr:tRNA pseudouridine(55) synthase TruB [Oceanirhabdus sp. W0125-5]WBW94837.1 tRNA pseudouridine(55) synthase TruB [Oceanirhabdus sp. W0125-5]
MNGIININKPKGITSFDVVRIIKKTLKMKKVGHTGTLDPMAEGVLPICIGKATKFAELIMSEEKVYRAEMKLGEITDTYDIEGEITETFDFSHVTEEEVIKVVNSFIKTYEQIPPIYSAIKVAGKRLYEYAREGKEVEIKGRKITIHNINNIEVNLPYIKFDVKCSKGTYIRSLCFDIGKELNAGGVMTSLIRLKSGIFNIEDSVEISEIEKKDIQDNIISIENIFSHLNELNLNEKFSKLVSNGVVIKDKALISSLEKNKQYRVYSFEREFIGLGELGENGFKIFKRYS